MLSVDNMEDATLTSLTLDRFLDYLQLSKDDIDSRVSMYRHLEVLAGAVDYQPDFQPTIITGSTIDGITWKGYMSDLDSMILIPYVKVTDGRHGSELEDQKGFLFEMTDDGVHPGYTFLKLIREDLEMSENMFSMTYGGVKSLCVDQGDGVFYLSSYKMKRCFMRYQQVHERPPWVCQLAYHYGLEWPDDDEVLEHGPSVCFSDKSKGDTPNDAVPSFPCPKWPAQANEWITRDRQWPPKDIVDKIVSAGCKLVPVGFVGSKTRHMEWRISFALSERELIKSFNNTQHKCYALLKMLLKEVLCKDEEDGLASFHMKNTILWSIERSDPKIWCPEKITTAFQLCIDNLYDWIKTGVCPSYFIPTNNVFEGKTDSEDLAYFQKSLKGFARDPEGWKILLQCPSLTKDNDIVQLLDHVKEKKDPLTNVAGLQMPTKASIWFQHDMMLFPRYEHARVELMTRIDAGNDTRLAIAEHYEVLDELERRRPKSSYSGAIDPLKCSIESSLGSHLQALALSANDDVDKEEIIRLSGSYLSRGVKSDATAGRLKLANFLYMNGDIAKCLALAEEVTRNDHLLPVYVPQLIPCLKGPSPEQILKYQSFVEKSVEHTPERRFLESASHAIIFLPSETASAPDAVKYQLRKVLPEPLDYTYWLRWAAYDPLVYAHFLCYACRLHQNMPTEAEASLMKIEELLDRGYVGYEVSCLNLLGYAYLALLKQEKAVAFFLRAVEKELVPSSVVWQLSACLCNRMKEALKAPGEKKYTLP